MRELIFLGPPGSGKGTQAARMAQIMKIPHISTGEILRDHVSRQTALGQQAKTYMDMGDLVPDQLILDMVTHRLSEPDAETGWILDGFPRNVSQAQFVQEHLLSVEQKNGRIPERDHVWVINLEVPDDVILQRLLLRGREDDREETILHRLQVYREQTAPLIEFYSSRNQLHHINGDRPMEEVTDSLKEVINS